MSEKKGWLETETIEDEDGQAVSYIRFECPLCGKKMEHQIEDPLFDSCSGKIGYAIAEHLITHIIELKEEVKGNG